MFFRNLESVLIQFKAGKTGSKNWACTHVHEWPSDVRGPKIPPQIILSASIFEHVFHKEACNWDRPAYLLPTSNIIFPYTFKMIPWRRKWQPTLVFLPGKSHEQRSLAGYSPCGCRVGHNLATKPPPPVLYPINISSPLPSRREIWDLFSISSLGWLMNKLSLLQTLASQHLANWMLGEQTWFSNRTSLM